MLAEANMKGAARTSDLEETSEDDAVSVEGDGTKDNAIMQNDDDVQDTGQPILHPPQVAGYAGSNTAADGSPPTEASAQSPPGEPVVGAQE